MTRWQRWRREERERELDVELRDHVERLTADFVAAGMAKEEARRRALLAFGNVALVKEDTRAVSSWVWLEQVFQDIRYALRVLSKRPVATTVAVLSLALGIGVNTAMFSVFDRLLMRRLPVPTPDHIVNVLSPGPRPGSSSTSDSGRSDAIFSYPLFRDLEQLSTGALRMAAHRDFTANLANRGAALDGRGLLVSGHYFAVLGVVPALGRLLGPDDDRVPGGHPVVVLSHDYWRTRFGSDPRVLADTLIVNGEAMSIVGVAPEGFSGTTLTYRPQVFVPLAMATQAFREPEWNGLSARNNHWLYVLGRLEPGVSRSEAERRINVPFDTLIHEVEFPALRSGMGDVAREQFQKRRIVLEDGARGQSADRAEFRTILTLLLAVSALVLAIACANVANLLLSRVLDRSAEMSLRLSLGAATGRLVRLLLVEACALGLLGGTAALLIARITLDGLVAILPVDGGPLLTFELNGTVLFFTLALGLGTSLLFGLFPAVHGVRFAAAAGLHTQVRVSGSRSARRFRGMLATTQIALATALLALAGLFVTSLVNVARVELGIRRDGLVTFQVSPQRNGYTPERSTAFFERVEEELRALPDVTAASASTVPVLSNSSRFNNVTVEGFNAGPDADTRAFFARASTDYFRTLGIPLLSGRDFGRADIQGSAQVAIVNEAFARKFAFGSRIVGRRMALGAGNNKPLDIEIVGLVRDATYSSVTEAAPPQFYMPYRQANAGTLTFYVRTEGDTRPLVAAIPSLVGRLDANLPIVNLRTMDDQIWDNTTRDRVLSTLSASFAVLATLLAAIGLYAVLAYGVGQRLREFGIRIALGAQGRDVYRLVLSQIAWMSVPGVAIGAGLAIGLGRLGQAMLFGVESTDALVVGGASLLALLVAIAAGAVPARQASHVNPADTLRTE